MIWYTKIKEWWKINTPRDLYLRYPILFILIFVVFFHIFKNYINYTDIDSARYMLSALIQSEAAVIAIVVTLSLVAVQLMATSIHPTVVEVFKKSLDLWILMISYILTIIYTIVVLKMIKNTDQIALIETHIVFTCIFGFFCIMALIPYTYAILDKLKLSNMIYEFAQRINKETLLKKDPIYPIVQIINKSIESYDVVTTQAGLGIIKDTMINIYKTQELTDDNDSKISDKLLKTHLYSVSKLARDQEDQQSTIELIFIITEIGKVSINKEKLDATTRKSSWLMNFIGIQAAKRAHRWATSYSIICLFDGGNEILDELEKRIERYRNSDDKSRIRNLIGILRGRVSNLKKISDIAYQKRISNDISNYEKKKWIEIEDNAKSFSEELSNHLENLITRI